MRLKPRLESLSRKPPWQRGVEKTTSTIALRATISGWRYIQHPPKTGSWRFIRQALEPRFQSLGPRCRPPTGQTEVRPPTKRAPGAWPGAPSCDTLRSRRLLEPLGLLDRLGRDRLLRRRRGR